MSLSDITNTLRQGHCEPCEGGVQPLDTTEASRFLEALHPDWQLLNNKAIKRELRFDNFYGTMAFVNAIAWIAHQEDHHPDLEIGYNRCVIHYTTHAIGGLSKNDFICASRIDALAP